MSRPRSTEIQGGIAHRLTLLVGTLLLGGGEAALIVLLGRAASGLARV